MTRTIGIDFGTTKTLVSYYDPASKTSGYVRLGRGMDKMPTSVFVDEDGVWQFGDDADDFMNTDPMRYRRDFKLDLGKRTPCLVTRIAGKIQQFKAQDLVAKFFQYIKAQCEETVFHERVSSCTVTHPVSFSVVQRNELEAAAREAGFEEIQLLPEPEAAGYAYYNFGADRHLLRLMVVDWGGGTVDFAMIEYNNNEIGLIPESSDGAANVGGRKFDELLFSHLSRKIVQGGGRSLEDDGGLQLIKHVCNCKEKLSRVTVVKQVLLVGEKGTYRTEVDRDEFNCLIAPVVNQAIEHLKTLLGRCAVKPQGLLLIGGSSSIPFIRERLEAAIGLPCIAWDKVNEAVSMGAAWYGSAILAANETQSSEMGQQEYDVAPVAESRPVEKKCWRSGRALESYIQERKLLHEDSWLLFRSMFCSSWHLNDVEGSSRALADEIGKIAQGDDPKIVVMRVRQGLNAVDLGNFDEFIENFATGMIEFLKGVGEDFDKNYIELYPSLKVVSQQFGPRKMDQTSWKREIVSQMGTLRSVYDDIVYRYNTLCEGFARYDKIMAGNSFWLKAIVGGALGFFTGGLGVAAAVAWGGWTDMNDKDFTQNYSNAIIDFCSACDAFAAQGEAVVKRITTLKQDFWNRLFALEEAFLRKLNAEGVDLDHVERQLDEKDAKEVLKSLDENTVYLFAMAFNHLRQDSSIPSARIDKLIQRCIRVGYPLAPDGSVNEAALQALVPPEIQDDTVVERFRKIVKPCVRFDRFYVLDAIPQDKLVNALHDYGTGLNAENVLCLYDSTLFGGGGDGFMIVPGGICWKQTWCDPLSCTWEEMKTISANGTTVLINNLAVDIPFGGAQAFVKMFRQLKAFFMEK